LALYKSAIFSLLKIPPPILMVIFFHAFGIAASWGMATAVALIVALFFFIPRVQPHYKPVPGFNTGIIGSMWRYSSGSYFVISVYGMAGIGYVWFAVQGVVCLYAILAMRARYRVRK